MLDAGGIIEPREREQFKGHDEVSLQKKKIPISGKFSRHANEMEPTTKTPSLEKLKLQVRRITAMQELQACLDNKKEKAPRLRDEIRRQTKNTIEKFVRDSEIGNAKEKQTLEKLNENRGN